MTHDELLLWICYCGKQQATFAQFVQGIMEMAEPDSFRTNGEFDPDWLWQCNSPF